MTTKCQQKQISSYKREFDTNQSTWCRPSIAALVASMIQTWSGCNLEHTRLSALLNTFEVGPDKNDRASRCHLKLRMARKFCLKHLDSGSLPHGFISLDRRLKNVFLTLEQHIAMVTLHNQQVLEFTHVHSDQFNRENDGWSMQCYRSEWIWPWDSLVDRRHCSSPTDSRRLHCRARWSMGRKTWNPWRPLFRWRFSIVVVWKRKEMNSVARRRFKLLTRQ